MRMYMYEFSLTWFFIGIAVAVGGAMLMRFYKEVADNFGSGVGSYQRYKLVALITCISGILIMFNLHNLVLGFIANLIFGGALR